MNHNNHPSTLRKEIREDGGHRDREDFETAQLSSTYRDNEIFGFNSHERPQSLTNDSPGKLKNNSQLEVQASRDDGSKKSAKKKSTVKARLSNTRQTSVEKQIES